MRRITVLLFTLAMIAVLAVPAIATVHPIQSGDCNGFNAPFSPSGGDPPGITGQSEADNFAKPLFASGVVIGFDSEGEPIIDFTNPALNGDNGNCPNGSPDF